MSEAKNTVTCPECETDREPKPDGTCPACDSILVKQESKNGDGSHGEGEGAVVLPGGESEGPQPPNQPRGVTAGEARDAIKNILKEAAFSGVRQDDMERHMNDLRDGMGYLWEAWSDQAREQAIAQQRAQQARQAQAQERVQNGGDDG
jgi:hypothetical protein